MRRPILRAHAWDTIPVSCLPRAILAIVPSFLLPVISQTTAAQEWPTPVNIAETPYSGTPSALTVDGERLVLTTAGTITVFNVADPNAPRFLGFDQTSGSTQAHAVAGEHAYVVGYHAGLDVHALKNPAEGLPTISSYSFADAHNFSGVGVSGTRVYASGYGTDLSVFDIADPAQPLLVGSAAVDTGGSPDFAARHIRIIGDTILMAGSEDDWGAVKIFRDRPGGDPAFLGEFRVIDLPGSRPPGVSRRIEGVYRVAFVADSGAGLIILDVTDPTSPRRIESAVSGTPVDDLAIAGDEDFLVTATCSECSVFDIGDPAAPTARGRVPLTDIGSACQVRVAVARKTAYVAGDQALLVIDLSDPDSPMVVGRFELRGLRARDVKLAGNLAYVAAEVGIVALDISDPTTPIALGGDGGGMYYSLEIDGTRAVARRDSQNFVDLFDLGQDGRSPSHAGFVFVDSISSYDVAGNRLYVARPNAGVVTYNISDPASPSIIGNVSGDEWRATQIDVRGTTAFVRNFEQGFAIFDVSDPNQPALVGQFSDAQLVTGFVVDGCLAYLTQTTSVAAHNVELVILDISDPAQPHKLGSAPAMIGDGASTDLAVANGFLFGVVPGIDQNGFAFDVVHPTAPVFVCPSIGSPSRRIDHVEGVGNRLYLARGYLGFGIFEATLNTPRLDLKRLLPADPRPLRLTWNAPPGVPFSIESSRDLSTWQPVGRYSDRQLDQALGLVYDAAPDLPAFFRISGR